MLTEHQHKPGGFDPSHCRDCARQTDLLDHYHRVQREELTLKEAHWWARRARRDATWALWVGRHRDPAGRHRPGHELIHLER